MWPVATRSAIWLYCEPELDSVSAIDKPPLGRALKPYCAKSEDYEREFKSARAETFSTWRRWVLLTAVAYWERRVGCSGKDMRHALSCCRRLILVAQVQRGEVHVERRVDVDRTFCRHDIGHRLHAERAAVVE